MAEDIVRQLGYLTLGTRMKRLGERIQADTQRILEANGIAIPAAQFPILAAIDRQGPRTIGELARALGVSQPGVTRTVLQLEEAGLTTIKAAKDDQRRRLVSLTPQGQRLVETGKRKVWPVIESAVRDLCHELTGPLLEQLTCIEDGLAATPLHKRSHSKPGRKR